MNERDELADSLWRLAPSMYEMDDCRSLAADLIDDGWRKTAPEIEARIEWGVRRPPRFNSTIAWMTSRSEAESLAASWDNGSKVVSRTVYVGPWTEVQG